MTQCWSEGELRAYLDGELPTRDVARVAAHLKDCQACNRVCADLAGRAARVAAWLEVLPEPVAPLKAPAMPRGPARTGRWVGVVGLAAALTAVLVMGPWRTRVGLRPVQGNGADPEVLVLPPPAGPLPIGRGSPNAVLFDRPLPKGRGSEKHGTVAPPKQRVEDYVALDDEPIEAGVVVRVGLSGGQVPADVILGPDGRARAIRLVSDISGER